MKKLYQQADGLTKELQIIADNLAEYNPGLCKRKVPLETIQYDIASLIRDLSRIHAEIGKKIKKIKLQES